MSLRRRLQSEWLDRLPADDPRAIRTRRDLHRINAWMLNAHIMARVLVEHGVGPPRTIVDLGSGDGQFILRVARRLAPHWPKVTVILQDRQDIVSRATRQGFAALQWRLETSATDVFDFLETTQFACADVITSNLFLHHFTDAQLTRLFAKAAQSARLLVACEPRRARFVVGASHLPQSSACDCVGHAAAFILGRSRERAGVVATPSPQHRRCSRRASKHGRRSIRPRWRGAVPKCGCSTAKTG